MNKKTHKKYVALLTLLAMVVCTNVLYKHS